MPLHPYTERLASRLFEYFSHRCFTSSKEWQFTKGSPAHLERDILSLFFKTIAYITSEIFLRETALRKGEQYVSGPMQCYQTLLAIFTFKTFAVAVFGYQNTAQEV